MYFVDCDYVNQEVTNTLLINTGVVGKSPAFAWLITKFLTTRLLGMTYKPLVVSIRSIHLKNTFYPIRI